MHWAVFQEHAVAVARDLLQHAAAVVEISASLIQKAMRVF